MVEGRVGSDPSYSIAEALELLGDTEDVSGCAFAEAEGEVVQCYNGIAFSLESCSKGWETSGLDEANSCSHHEHGMGAGSGWLVEPCIEKLSTLRRHVYYRVCHNC
jgi:hypothetical protein